MAEIEKLLAVRPELRWTPTVGRHTLDFQARKTADVSDVELERVLFEAQTILGRCVPPEAAEGKDTGLVVGYVQSGKTLSFTNVMALARDNGYRLVILLAGTGNNLKSQSEARLLSDLGVEEEPRAWVNFQNPDPKQGDAQAIENILSAWSREGIPEHRRRAVLITVLKNHTRLDNLVSVLQRINLSRVPSLVIDDEADQASPNTRSANNRRTGRSDVSPTYKSILELKAALPHHTLLQYTATPQANLLIGLADVLSPSFAELVTPGESYVGGKRFFLDSPPLVRIIPQSDIPNALTTFTSAPPSLASAVRLFLLGAAVHFIGNQKGHRSMMVHPSQQTGPHEDYKQWIDSAVIAWRRCLDEPEGSEVRNACIELFRASYLELAESYPAMPGFDEVVKVLSFVIEASKVVQVNSKRQGNRDVKWKQSDYWIVVGGQKLDRGFTVEGLIVTYMPRTLGTGNADNLQQRARFFGYKKSFEGLCRVFVPQDVRDALTGYVDHEEFVRAGIRNNQGKPLARWKRDFILDRALHPTRAGVIGVELNHVPIDSGWHSPGRLQFGALVDRNRQVLASAEEQWRRDFPAIEAGSLDEFRDRRVDSARNMLIRDIPVRRLLADFFLEFECGDFDDACKHTSIGLLLGDALQKDPGFLCDVFMIGSLSPQTRSLTQGGRINQVFSGKSPNTADNNSLIYVGDRALRTPRPTLHLRNFNLRESQGGRSVATEVPWYAIWLPRDVAKDVVVTRNER